MKKYHKYGHHKKKKWRSLTLQFLLNFVGKNARKDKEAVIYLPAGKYNESISLFDGINLTGIQNNDHGITSSMVSKNTNWPPKIVQREFSDD